MSGCAPRQHRGPIEPRRKDTFNAVWFCVACEKRVGTKTVPLDLLPREERHGLKPLRARKHRARPGRRRKNYDRFMRSATWRRQQDRVWKQHGGSRKYPPPCYVPGCEQPGRQCAHLKYATPIEDTPDEWIRPCCKAHNMMERDNRVAFGRRAS